MSASQFLREIEKGLPAPAYLFYSEDPYLLKEAELNASMVLPEGERDFGVVAFDLDGADEKPSMGQLLDALNTMPFMGGRKIVVISNIQEITKREMPPLEGYLGNPSPHSVLVLLLRGTLKGPFRDLSKLMRTISLDIRPQDFPAWLREKARHKGLSLTDRAIDYLLGLMGPDVGLLSSEIEKLVLVGKTPVDREDLAGIVSGSSDYNVFDLVNAIKAKNRREVFRIARALQETTDPYGVLGAINWHYTRLAAQEQREGAYYDRIFHILHEADAGIKTSGGNYPLEYLLVTLLRA